jgi:dynamin 1-like protein
VRQEIENLTDKVCGKSKNIIDKPIVLNVFSHTCPDLTLIDLPGITRIPLAGSDQPENIEKITRQMA